MSTPLARPLGVIAAAAVVALAGCAPTVASGPVTSEERDIPAITTVVLQTSGDLSISEGEPRLVISAASDALEHLTSEVDGDVLALGVTTGIMLRLGTVRYELTVPDLEAITMDGSGDVEWTGLAARRIEISVAGSGDVTLSGTAQELGIEIGGSGNVHGADLRAQAVDVVVRGSGDVDVSPVDSLSVDILGSGTVTYSGEPTLDTTIAGSGEVVRR